MITLTTFDQIAAYPHPLHVAIGVFDGLHIGHQAVLKLAINAAHEQGGEIGLVSFDPHPIRVIAPNKAPKALLTPLAHKAEIARRLGVGVFVPLHFDPSMAALEATAFLDNLTRADIRTIAVGEDWRFGHNRAGDVSMLAREAHAKGFRLQAVPPVMWDGDRISSTRIRQALHDGNLADVEQMLGRPWSLRGEVSSGQRLGRTLGFSTANIVPRDVQLPPHGVWVAQVETADGRNHDAVANLGMRPTVDGTELRLEVHLLDFERDLYGQVIETRFLHHIRPEQRFESLESLREAIASDVATARLWFAANNEG
jgi:riboflavin kinase/FMN adenylyltransferase